MNRMLRGNAVQNATNRYQGNAIRILTVCSAGLLRSPTLAEEVIKRGANARAAGSEPNYALILPSEPLLEWADMVMFVGEFEKVAFQGYCDENLNERFLKRAEERLAFVALNIPDSYAFRDPTLVEFINKALDEKDEFIKDFANQIGVTYG